MFSRLPHPLGDDFLNEKDYAHHAYNAAEMTTDA